MSLFWPTRAARHFDYISGPPSREYRRKPRRKLAIFGSTGSIGRSALNVAEHAPQLEITALACGENIELLASQANRWRPPFLAVKNERLAASLLKLLAKDYCPKIHCGQPGYASLACLDEIDCVLAAQSGSAGLAVALSAAYAGKTLALANKESLVMAGDLLRRVCRASGASILPVDSEHYAIFQCLAGSPAAQVHRLILTASGGPFLHMRPEETANASPMQALQHPNWNMGAKISIDSATMMNKGLEFIEAMRLFDASADQVSVVVHPQSIVHSLVQFTDNSLLAQMAVPDMRLPIAACLLWPDRQTAVAKPLDLCQMPPLTFEKPDLDAFPCLGLAIRAATCETSPAWQETGLNPACIALNAANEIAVQKFAAEDMKFGQIAEFNARALNTYEKLRPEPAGAIPRHGAPHERALAVVDIVNAFAASMSDLTAQ